MKFNPTTYQSSFTWRYGSEKMRRIFSEENKYRLWRKIWVALAKAQYKAGLVSKKELEDLEKHKENIDIERILAIEKETKHDVVAAIKEFAEKAKLGGGRIHLGATSMDVVDNADVLRMKQALDIVAKRTKTLLNIFAEKIDQYARLPCIGYTHLQPAEPTTVGYRLAFYAQDLLTDFDYLQFVKDHLRGKGMKGAVGTSASFMALCSTVRGVHSHTIGGGTPFRMTAKQMEQQVMQSLGIEASLISSQVYSRKTDYLVLSLLASIASTVHKFAFDLRVMQSPQIGEWSEPFGKKQVGSSAMPFKKNPIKSENICSLSRYIAQLPRIAWDNAGNSLLERTLDDSANRRIIIPEAFLATDQILITGHKILSDLVINKKRIDYNLTQYGPFAATEVILMETVKNGANRQQMHELLREISMKAWEQVQKGNKNPIVKLLAQNDKIGRYLPSAKIKELIEIKSHIGAAPKKALRLAKQIKDMVNARK